VVEVETLLSADYPSYSGAWIKNDINGKRLCSIVKKERSFADYYIELKTITAEDILRDLEGYSKNGVSADLLNVSAAYLLSIRIDDVLTATKSCFKHSSSLSGNIQWLLKSLVHH